jgi:hypothetical protein
MKKNDSSDFSVFYVEPDDERDELFQVLAGQRKPVVLMLAEQTRVFQRPDDFTMLKLAKRRHALTIIFVIPQPGPGTLLASKNGFPVFSSMDQLADAVQAGHVTRQRALAHPAGSPGRRITLPLDGAQFQSGSFSRVSTLDSVGQGRPTGALHVSVDPDPASRQPPVYFTNNVAAEPQALMLKHSEEQIQAAASPARSYSAPGDDDVTEPFNDVSRPVSAPLPFLHAPGSEKVTPLRKRRLSLIPTMLVLAVLLGLVGSFLVIPHTFLAAPSALPAASHLVTPAIVGHVTYVSSEQLSENSNQGIADETLVSLQNIRPPAPGKQYYAWLLGDRGQSDPITVALGMLSVSQGTARLLYPGDAQHSNLLLNTGRFLVTEEDASVPPLAPSTNASTWRYYGEFSSTPMKTTDGTPGASYLDHLRHLLAADPTLDSLGLPGGLNTWLYRNTGKLVEWSTSMRESWEATKNTGFVHRQTTRILTYLDGTTFLYRDLPAHQPLLVEERLARVGLLNIMGPNQQPPSYLDHIDRHLRGLLQADATPQNLRLQIDEFTAAMSNVELWLKNVHRDAVKIVGMSDAQLRAPATLSLLNDMIDNINHAFAGQLDPLTGQMREGVSWLHDNMNALATLDITPVQAHASGLVPLVPQMVGGRAHALMHQEWAVYA